MVTNLLAALSKLIHFPRRPSGRRKDTSYPSDETVFAGDPGISFCADLNDSSIASGCSCGGSAEYSSFGIGRGELRIQCNDNYGGRTDCFHAQVRRRNDWGALCILRSRSVSTYEKGKGHSDKDKNPAIELNIGHYAIEFNEIPTGVRLGPRIHKPGSYDLF